MIALITQSNYIPWKGYFDSIHKADVFVLYDDMQYTRRDWRNRNIIKTPQGAHWLTIPVNVKGKYLQKISETEIADPSWTETHWKTIVANYSKAPHFKTYKATFEELFLDCEEKTLSLVNYRFLKGICELLEIRTKFMMSSELQLRGDKSEKILNACLDLKADEYLSGPAAKDYLDVGLFEKNGVKVTWADYENYPPYKQLHGEFDHKVSILDLIFNEGPNATRFMKTF